jgi:hypothetical protein
VYNFSNDLWIIIEEGYKCHNAENLARRKVVDS